MYLSAVLKVLHCVKNVQIRSFFWSVILQISLSASYVSKVEGIKHFFVGMSRCE